MSPCHPEPAHQLDEKSFAAAVKDNTVLLAGAYTRPLLSSSKAVLVSELFVSSLCPVMIHMFCYTLLDHHKKRLH